jgi:nucleoside-diphosphate-sugar epimerase
MKIYKSVTLDVLMRVVADMIIVNATYMAGLFIRSLWHLPGIEEETETEVFHLVQIYGQTFWLLTIVTVIVYSLSGFYSRGRYYESRFKLLVIFQAVSLAYVFFGFALYMILAREWLVPPPRAALLLSWLLTLGATVGARWWAKLWRLVLEREAPNLRKPKSDERIRHVLVIGGAGYIGSVLCRKLLERGYSVRVLDAFLYGRKSLADLSQHPRFTVIEGDSREVSAVFKAMSDMDAVVHLGELVGDPACALDEKLTLEVNLAATRMVAEAAKGCGVQRFVYASSCSVYGASDEILDERSVLNPVSLYARAKIGAEQILRGLNDTEFHPVILRFATVYGLSPRPRFDVVVNLLTAKAVCEGEITIFGGDQWRPFVHVADAAQAIVLSLEAPLVSVKGGAFNVGSDEQNYTISQVGELIQRLVPNTKVVHQGKDVDRRNYHVSFVRIQRGLGFRPQFTVEDGIKEIEAAVRKGEIKNYQDFAYNNYQTLSDVTNLISARSRHISNLYAVPPALETDGLPLVQAPSV